MCCLQYYFQNAFSVSLVGTLGLIVVFDAALFPQILSNKFLTILFRSKSLFLVQKTMYININTEVVEGFFFFFKKPELQKVVPTQQQNGGHNFSPVKMAYNKVVCILYLEIYCILILNYTNLPYCKRTYYSLNPDRALV